jgi:C-terminal processing protease CtpA/Prc
MFQKTRMRIRMRIWGWYTPDNQSINGQGITPDIIVDLEGEFGTETDSQIQRAIELILSEEA